MAKALLSNGTTIYIVDPQDDNTVHKLCAVALELSEGEPSKIDVTTLCETKKTQEVDGLYGSSTSTITVNFDPQSDVQNLLLKAKDDKRELMFRVGASDGTNEAQWDTTDKKWQEDTTRSWWDFKGSISSIPWSFAVNSAVQPQISINMMSEVVFTAKS